MLKVRPGYDYSSVLDPSSQTLTPKPLAYKEIDGEFFKQKDIELVDEQVQSIDFVLLQNLESSPHMLSLLLEVPLEGNHDAFMHGEPKPDCLNNECIFADKMFNSHSINYVFNSNIINRVRLWLYRESGLVSATSCSSYHLTVKSRKHYLETHPAEKVA